MAEPWNFERAAIPRRGGNRQGYLLAASLVAFVLVVKVFVVSVVGHITPYLLFSVAVLIATWYGGLGPGLFAVVATTLAALFFFTEPAYTFHLERREIPALLFYIVQTLLIVAFMNVIHRTRLKLQDSNAELSAELSARLEAQHALKQLNENLERQVAERTEALETSNRELQDFAHVTSHDLQEPLRKIQSFAALLRAEHAAALDEEARFYLERITDASARMSQLISDILAFSRVLHRSAPYQRLDLDGLLATVLGDLQMRLAETGGRVEAEPLPELEADASQMHQLLLNLIGNALKFHRKGEPPVVRVSGRVQPAPAAGAAPLVEITVRDNGIGFDDRDAERIFAPFRRLHGRAAYEGTGIGLAICRRIAERHGGRISAEGRPGAGAAFTVTLPQRQTPLAEP